MLEIFRDRLPRFVRRLAERAIARRAFDGAGGGRRWDRAPTFGNINDETLRAGATMRRRGAYYAANNPHVASAIAGLVAAMVGSGITPTGTHPDEKVRAALQRAWSRWTLRADADGLTDFHGLVALAVRTMIEAGECFVRIEAGDDGLPILRLVDPELVDRANTRELGEGRRIVGGIEFDGRGRRVAYHVFRDRPGTPFLVAGETVRVPAADMIHLFRPVAPGQVRGASWLAPVLLRLHELDQYEDAQIVRQKTAALFTAFVVDPQGGTGAGAFDGTQNGSVLDSGLEPGAMKVLPPGYDIRFSEPAAVGDGIEFMKLVLRSIAAGLGVPEHVMTGDLGNANYSSLRAATVEFRRRVEQVQYDTIIHQLCRPVWERFVLSLILAGRLGAPGFERDPDLWLGVEWLPPVWPWVDPLKDVEAEERAVAAGFKSRRQVVAERGWDIEALDAERAADRARAQRLGVSVEATPFVPALPDTDTRRLSVPAEFSRRLALAPETADETTRTVAVVASTGARVQRRDQAGPYWEELDLSAGSYPDQAPALDAHHADRMDDQLGIATGFTVRGGVLHAVVEFDQHPKAERIFRSVLKGHFSSVSIGYAVHRWSETRDSATGERVKRAVEWTLIELSFVPVPADPGAHVRKEPTNA